MDELREIQNKGALSNVYSLVMSCRRRYLEAASLLEIDNEHVQRVKDFALQSIDLAALLPSYEVLCQRYRTELYSLQGELWQTSFTDVIGRAWTEFYYWRFLPTVIWEDAFVRNVLRSLGALPARDPEAAAKNIYQHIADMRLPEQRPASDQARRIDL